ncbi:hypothetical protein GQR36_00735 [Enterococcus termitis]
MKKNLKILLGIVVVAVAAILAYVGYVYFSYSRIKDQVSLEVVQHKKRNDYNK